LRLISGIDGKFHTTGVDSKGGSFGVIAEADGPGPKYIGGPGEYSQSWKSEQREEQKSQEIHAISNRL